MNDEDLIGYCEIHCTTERALFSGVQVNRMIELAGFPSTFVSGVKSSGWFSIYQEMQELCDLARARLQPTKD